MIQFIIISIVRARYMRRFALFVTRRFLSLFPSFSLFFFSRSSPRMNRTRKVCSIDTQKAGEKKASADYELSVRGGD